MPLGARPRSIKNVNIVKKIMYTLDDILDEGSKFQYRMFISFPQFVYFSRDEAYFPKSSCLIAADGVTLHSKKTKIMYTSRNSGEPAPFMVGDTNLEYTSHYKYFGVEINAHNKVTATVQNLCTRSWKAIFKLNSILAGTDIPALIDYHYSTN